MKALLLLALCAAPARAATADAWPRPKLKAHERAVGGDALARELQKGQENFFALQDYYLGFGKSAGEAKASMVHEVTEEEALWASTQAAKESKSLAALIKKMDKVMAGPVETRPGPAPAAPLASYAVFALQPHPEGWERFMALANLAGNLVYHYRLRRAGADQKLIVQAREWESERRAALLKAEQEQAPK